MLPFYQNWSSEFHSFEWQTPHAFFPHIHHELELMYVVEGAIDAAVDFRERRLQPGDLAVIFPHSVHGYLIPSPLPSVNRMWGMVIAPPLTGEFEQHLNQMSARQPFIPALAMNPEVCHIIQQMFRNHYAERPLITKAYLQLLLAYIWPQLEVEPKNGRQMEDILSRVIQYVLDHYRRPLHAKDVAATLGISPYYLARIFSQQLHMSFNDYVNRLRIQAAQDLLRSTDRPVTEVMLEVGFESQSTFNRVFRDIQGITPREYRQQSQN